MWTEGPSLSIHVNVTDSGLSFTNAASRRESGKIFHASEPDIEILREDDRSAKDLTNTIACTEAYAARSSLHFKIALLISAPKGWKALQHLSPPTSDRYRRW
jgi:hypothetical protein